MLRYIIGLVALATIFSSCETEFNLTGDFQEKALVYGLLDPNDNPANGGAGHLFRIQKSFLGEESAFVMAQEPDSSYFKYDELYVELVEYDTEGDETNRWKLDTVTVFNKETGDPDDEEIDFFGPAQRLYSTNTPGSDIVNVDSTMNYEITLKKIPAGATNIPATMDTVTPFCDAITSIISTRSFKWNNPSEISPIAQPIEIFSTGGAYLNYSLRIQTALRAVQYEVWMRFHYREVVAGVETEKSMEWKVNTFEPGEEGNWQVSIDGAGFYSRIGSELSAEPNTIRKIGLADIDGDGHTQDIDIFIRMAGEELYQYLEINDPTNSGVLQDKPVYTNVNNGLGVFSTRTEAEFKGLYLKGSSPQELVDGQYTSGLGFVVDPD